MSCVWFCPESPRWLVSRGRIDDARAVMIKYHSTDGKTNPLIELQLREFQEMIEVRKMEPVWDYSRLVNTANTCWRLLALALMCINGQLAGNGVSVSLSLPPFLPHASTLLRYFPTHLHSPHPLLFDVDVFTASNAGSRPADLPLTPCS